MKTVSLLIQVCEPAGDAPDYSLPVEILLNGVDRIMDEVLDRVGAGLHAGFTDTQYIALDLVH